MIRASLPGSDFIETRCCRALSLNNFHYTLHCNRYKCVETNVEKEFRPEAFTQTGVRSESVKRTKTKGSMSTIDAMATKTEQRAIKSQTITLSSKVHRTKRLYPTKRQTKSQKSESYTNKCPCQISIILHSDSYFYLDVWYTNLHHTGHPPIPPRAKKLGSAEISDDKAFILQQLSVMGVQKSKISSLLSTMEESEGYFSVQTVKNYLNACEILNQKEFGLDNKMSSAEAAIDYLHR